MLLLVFQGPARKVKGFSGQARLFLRVRVEGFRV